MHKENKKLKDKIKAFEELRSDVSVTKKEERFDAAAVIEILDSPRGNTDIQSFLMINLSFHVFFQMIPTAAIDQKAPFSDL